MSRFWGFRHRPTSPRPSSPPPGQPSKTHRVKPPAPPPLDCYQVVYHVWRRHCSSADRIEGLVFQDRSDGTIKVLADSADIKAALDEACKDYVTLELDTYNGQFMLAMNRIDLIQATLVAVSSSDFVDLSWQPSRSNLSP